MHLHPSGILEILYYWCQKGVSATYNLLTLEKQNQWKQHFIITVLIKVVLYAYVANSILQ